MVVVGAHEDGLALMAGALENFLRQRIFEELFNGTAHGAGTVLRVVAAADQEVLSRGEQNRRSSVVSKTGIPLAAPSVFEEGERSDARRKD